MNLNSKERDILLEALDHYSDFGGEMSDKEYELFVNLQRKITQAEKDSWRPLSELPPLGLEIVLQRADEVLFLSPLVRKDLAKSYSPDIITLHDLETGRPLEFNTRHYYWRLKNA